MVFLVNETSLYLLDIVQVSSAYFVSSIYHTLFEMAVYVLSIK